MASQHIVYFGLGSNLGDRQANLVEAIQSLRGQVHVDRLSSVYETEPAYVTEQPRFLNMVAVFAPRPGLTPRALLQLLRAIETAHGRTHDVPQGPRTLDLDLLMFGEQVVFEPDLVVPHPRMGHRPFVLVPLLELLGTGAVTPLRDT